ncbi:MAG: type II secretion system F family protein [Eubacteriales bacterium]|nr:type II secretion system F family protein [Eubacteriales bacterium]
MSSYIVPFLVISYTALVLVIVVLILGKKGKEEDNNLRRMKAIGKETVSSDYKNVDTSFYERVIKPFVDKLNNVDENGKKPTKNAQKKKQNAQLARQLRQAGLHISVSNFQFFKTAFMLITLVISVGIGLALMNVTNYFYLVILIGCLIAILGPNMFLKTRVSGHQQAIRSQLPDTLDLMSVCMEAGLSFDASLVKISERMEGPLIDELVTVFKQIQLGKNRNEALKELSDSTDVAELKTFISAVIQANQLGIPITNVLAAQSEQLRFSKREEIKTVAAKVPSKMTIPTVLFILPAIIIIVMAPIIIMVMDSMSGMF